MRDTKQPRISGGPPTGLAHHPLRTLDSNVDDVDDDAGIIPPLLYPRFPHPPPTPGAPEAPLHRAGRAAVDAW